MVLSETQLAEQRVTPGTPTRLEPELELVLLCARTVLDQQTRDRIKELLGLSLDWELVGDFAGRHNTTALLFHHLSATSLESVPDALASSLRAYYFRLAAHNLRLVGEAASLLGEMDAAGAPGVLWKGPALAYSVYASPELRAFTDLDIIIRRRDVPRMRQLMESRGYLARPRVGVTEDELFSRRGEVVTMWNDEREIAVDVHWGSTGRYLSPVMDCERLWHESESLSMGGVSTPVLRSDWMLLALCAHGAKHGPFPWPALKWITDVDAIVRKEPEEWWDPLLSLARRTASYRMLLLGLHLARELLDAPLPPRLAELADEPRNAALSAPIRERLLAIDPATFEFADRMRFALAIRERTRDRANYALAQLLTPSRRDLTTSPGTSSLLTIPWRLARLSVRYLLNPARGRAFLFGTKEPRGEEGDEGMREGSDTR